MIDTDIGRICIRARPLQVFSLRSLLLYCYKHQANRHIRAGTVQLFDAFFQRRRDAIWCRKQVRRTMDCTNCTLWPPLTSRPPDTDFLVINVRNIAYIPVIPFFTDPSVLRK